MTEDDGGMPVTEYLLIVQTIPANRPEMRYVITRVHDQVWKGHYKDCTFYIQASLEIIPTDYYRAEIILDFGNIKINYFNGKYYWVLETANGVFLPKKKLDIELSSDEPISQIPKLQIELSSDDNDYVEEVQEEKKKPLAKNYLSSDEYNEDLNALSQLNDPEDVPKVTYDHTPDFHIVQTKPGVDPLLNFLSDSPVDESQLAQYRIVSHEAPPSRRNSAKFLSSEDDDVELLKSPKREEDREASGNLAQDTPPGSTASTDYTIYQRNDLSMCIPEGVEDGVPLDNNYVMTTFRAHEYAPEKTDTYSCREMHSIMLIYLQSRIADYSLTQRKAVILEVMDANMDIYHLYLSPKHFGDVQAFVKNTYISFVQCDISVTGNEGDVVFVNGEFGIMPSPPILHYNWMDSLLNNDNVALFRIPSWPYGFMQETKHELVFGHLIGIYFKSVIFVENYTNFHMGQKDNLFLLNVRELSKNLRESLPGFAISLFRADYRCVFPVLEKEIDISLIPYASVRELKCKPNKMSGMLFNVSNYRLDLNHIWPNRPVVAQFSCVTKDIVDHEAGTHKVSTVTVPDLFDDYVHIQNDPDHMPNPKMFRPGVLELTTKTCVVLRTVNEYDETELTLFEIYDKGYSYGRLPGEPQRAYELFRVIYTSGKDKSDIIAFREYISHAIILAINTRYEEIRSTRNYKPLPHTPFTNIRDENIDKENLEDIVHKAYSQLEKEEANFSKFLDDRNQ